MAEERQELEEIRSLTLLEWTRAGGVLGSALVVLTYVSGYLIATTYLRTYSVSADTSDFLRARYIYIGFYYLLFLAILGVCLHVAQLVLDLIARPLPPVERTTMREDVARELTTRRLEPDNPTAHWRSLRWGWTAALITVVFSFEILLMRPMEFRSYIALQSLFLLFLSLYQTSFYREYAKESYGWGVLWGRIYVRWVRYLFSLGLGTICFLLIAAKALKEHLKGNFAGNDLLHFLAWLYGLASHIEQSQWFTVGRWTIMTLTFFVASFLTLGSESLTWADARITGDRKQFLLAIIIIPLTVVRATWQFLCGVWQVVWRVWQFVWNARPFRLREAAAPDNFWTLFGRTFDSVALGLAALLYCVTAFDVWMGNPLRILWWWTLLDANRTAITCAYCTLALSLIVLVNILRLMWMHSQREQDLSAAGPTWLRRQSGLWTMTAQSQKSRAFDWRILARMAVPVTVLYLVSVLGFSHMVYPFIPADKAGGNYSAVDSVYVALDSGDAGCLSRDLTSQIQSKTDYIVIENTADWTYLAPHWSGQGPDCWKWGIFCPQNPKGKVSHDISMSSSGRRPDPSRSGTTNHPYFRPNVYSVARRCIASFRTAP